MGDAVCVGNADPRGVARTVYATGRTHTSYGWI